MAMIGTGGARGKRWMRRTGLTRRAFRTWERIQAADPRARRRNARYRHAPAPDGLSIPPTELIVRVSGTPDVGWFLEGGQLAAASIRDALRRNGVEIEQLQSILDFGCGCGRVMRYWHSLNGPALHGVDYNPELIDWCSRHLPFARFQTNRLAPPLGYADASFDCIYALSVFTHLPEDLQHAWMRELARVLRPGGYLLVTLQGERYLSRLSPDERRQFERGELVIRSNDAPGTNLCAAFHPEAYLRQHFAGELDLIEWAPEGAIGNPHQDLVLLRKPLAG